MCILEGRESTKMDMNLCLFAFLEQNSYVSACLRKLAGCKLFEYENNYWKTLPLLI